MTVEDGPVVLGQRMRLVEWGRQYGLSRCSTWQMLRDGRLPVHLRVERVGQIWYVLIPDAEVRPVRTVLYARVSSSGQSDDLVRQMGRLQLYAADRGWMVDEMVTETGSGLNGKRRRLLKVLGYAGRMRLVVERRDRLTRFGFEMIEAVLSANLSEIVVVDETEVEDDLVRDMTEVLTSMCARLYGRRSARNRGLCTAGRCGRVTVDMVAGVVDSEPELNSSRST